MGEKSAPTPQLDINLILAYLGFLGIGFNVPNFYNSLDFPNKMYFLWGCTVIVFTVVMISFNKRIRTTEIFCKNFGKFDNKEKEVIAAKIYEALSIINEMNKKGNN